MTWHDKAVEIIARVHASLPPDADLKTRKAALRAAKPYIFQATSWSRKVWQKAQKAYLTKHGLKPRGWTKLTPSPLEQAIARAKARDEGRAT